MWNEVLDALVDSAIALPFLLAIYLFIEFLESNKRAQSATVRLLNGKLAPLVAGGVGLVPQCGFSVMATDLYCQNYLKLGTLVAFFVATSDEALPILLTNGKTVGVVWVVLLVKVVYAVILGYLINLFDRRPLAGTYTLTQQGCCHHEFSVGADDSHSAEDPSDEHDAASQQAAEEVAHDEADDCHGHEHHHSTAERLWHFAKHPLFHTLKIFVYIFVVNTVFGLLMYFFSEPIVNFTSKLGFWQCFIVALVGLVPNCASSVVIVGMYTEQIVSLSAMLAGLVSNSGIALAILFRQRKWKRNLGIVALLYLAGVLVGVVGYFVQAALPAPLLG